MEPMLAIPIEDLVAEIEIDGIYADEAIAACQARFGESAPLFRRVLERAARGELDDLIEEDVLLVGLHVLAAGRDTLSCAPLLRLLRRPADELERLLGDILTESLSRIAASVFDGNADALFEAIADRDTAPMARWALFDAAAFLTWNGSIERQEMVRFLERFDDERLGDDTVEAWFGWSSAAGLLGLRAMTPRIEKAMRDGRIFRIWMGPQEWEQMLAKAEAAPDDENRFRDEGFGHVEDALAELANYHVEADWPGDPDFEADWAGDPDFEADEYQPLPIGVPVVNEWRHVGRNDPCPCGSGKKFKRCCLER